MVTRLYGAKHIVTLPPASCWNENSRKRPDHPEKSIHHEMNGINEKNPTLAILGLLKPGQKLLLEEIEL